VDSRTSFPQNMNLYQYVPQEPRRLPHLLQTASGPFFSQPPRF
jgi:hypothetical protein